MYSSFALQWREALHPLNSCAVSFGVGVEGVASLRVGDLDFDGETALKSRRLAGSMLSGTRRIVVKPRNHLRLMLEASSHHSGAKNILVFIRKAAPTYKIRRLLQVEASGVNPSDTYLRLGPSGPYAAVPHLLPPLSRNKACRGVCSYCAATLNLLDAYASYCRFWACSDATATTTTSAALAPTTHCAATVLRLQLLRLLLLLSLPFPGHDNVESCIPESRFGVEVVSECSS